MWAGHYRACLMWVGPSPAYRHRRVGRPTLGDPLSRLSCLPGRPNCLNGPLSCLTGPLSHRRPCVPASSGSSVVHLVEHINLGQIGGERR